MFNEFTTNGFSLCMLPLAQEIKPFFDSLVMDPYYGTYRYKAVSRFNFIDDKIILLPHADFFQNKNYNPVAGDIIRSYPPIDVRIIETKYLSALFKKISNHIDLTANTCFTTHQIRVVSSKDKKGFAAAEGIHQDGYDFIALNCITKENITGGITSLYTETKEKVFEKELVSGDILFVNDRQLFHYTTPIKNKTSEEGYRDMLIVTVSLTGARDIPI